MKKLVSFLILLILAGPSFALACHPDEHFGFLVAMDESAKTFTLYHTGDHPEMGGKLFSFSAEADLFKTLEVGTKVAVKFATDPDRLIAKEIRSFPT